MKYKLIEFTRAYRFGGDPVDELRGASASWVDGILHVEVDGEVYEIPGHHVKVARRDVTPVVQQQGKGKFQRR